MSVLFVTGAGISANAGIPTYRDGGSSWKDRDLEQKSHANRYGNHLAELWDKHWGPVSVQMKAAEPTVAHKAIAEFQKTHPMSIIATQNIDDLHERAGSNNIAHVHGTMDVWCMKCSKQVDAPWIGKGAPQCPECAYHKTRPDVILFGENLHMKQFRGLEKFARDADAIVAIGTSLNVFPVAGLVMDNTRKSIIINKEPTPFDKWTKATFHNDADEVIEEVLSLI